MLVEVALEELVLLVLEEGMEQEVEALTEQVEVELGA